MQKAHINMPPLVKFILSNTLKPASWPTQIHTSSPRESEDTLLGKDNEVIAHFTEISTRCIKEHLQMERALDIVLFECSDKCCWVPLTITVRQEDGHCASSTCP